MKRKTAKELLAESFRELAEIKNIDKITVQDIVDNCGYSPATFYRHYKDKYDLIAWEYSRQTANIMDRIGEDGYEWKQTQSIMIRNGITLQIFSLIHQGIIPLSSI